MALSVGFVHLLAAFTWIGGMLFSVLTAEGRRPSRPKAWRSSRVKAEPLL